MEVYLIADAGSTKTDWALVSSDSGFRHRWQSAGINPLLQSKDDIFSIIRPLQSEVPDHIKIDRIFFYGAGCLSETQTNIITDSLKHNWPGSELFVDSDMLAAGRAALGNKKGVVCILGTGSNSAMFNNGVILDKIPSMGFILGDEGSGAALGKRLLNAVFKKQLPDDILDSFFESFPITLPEVIEKTYRQPAPSAFLASFASFIREKSSLPEIKNLIIAEFSDFFTKNIQPYNLSPQDTIGFVGSIAFHFRDFLLETAFDFGFQNIEILNTPIDNLILYHLSPQNVN